MKLNLFALLLFVLSFTSCKKDKLEGDAAILTGTWNWTNTQKVTNTCVVDSLWVYSDFDSSYATNEYRLEFLSKGKVNSYHNESSIWKDRIVFESMEAIVLGPYTYEFNIYLDNNKNNIMHGFVGQDSLLLDNFPKDSDVPCETRHNHFIRE